MPVELGLFTDALPDRPLAEVARWLRDEGPEVRCLEIGTGGYSPAPHCDRELLLGSAEARSGLLEEIAQTGLRLVALNVSGNPLEVAEHDRALRETIRLAPLLEVGRVVCMSGGRAELAGAGWFEGLETETEGYWEGRVLPYWSEIAGLAQSENGTLRLCLELEPGSAVFNVSTFERVASLGEAIAVNLDPSHFFWQSIDPLAAVRRLGSRVGFAHAKDTVLDRERVVLDGLIDRGSWRYATVGDGHDVDWWRAFLTELRSAGYEGPISIEYEDELVPAEESVARAAAVVREAAAGL